MGFGKKGGLYSNNKMPLLDSIYKRNYKYKKELAKKATYHEKLFYLLLKHHEQKFIFQKGFLKPFHRIVDFYIPNKKLIIEIDGEYHKDTVEKDRIKDEMWAKKGYQTLRITNKQVDMIFKDEQFP